MSDNAPIYPALIHALKLLFLQIKKSNIDDKAVDHKRAIQGTLDILFSDDAVPYSTLLASFELLHILAKNPAGKVVLARQRQKAEANNPLTGEMLDESAQNEPTLAKEVCKTLCERYLFAPPDSDRLFRDDLANSRVSIKTLVILVSSTCIGIDSSIIDLKIYDSVALTQIATLSEHDDPGLKGAVAHFVSNVILTNPPELEPYVDILVYLLMDESHQAVLKAIQGIKHCIHQVLRQNAFKCFSL